MGTKITLKLLAVCLFAALTIHLSAQDVGVSGNDREAILDTIAQINHINWVVNVIKTYNNAMILEEEYEKISYGNLDMNRIPDEETLGRISKTLDTLHSLRKDEREMRHWVDKFNDDRMRKMREYDLESSKRVWGLFKGGILGFMTGDIGKVLQTAYDIGYGALSLQYDYDNFVHGFDQEKQDRIFAFDSQKLDLLHMQNKEMLDDQWRLVRKYRLNDKATRVTDTDIKTLLSILKDGNASRIYTRLAPMKSRYSLFPEYWYYLSCASIETGRFKEGREACDTFFKVNRGIFRNDPMASTVALNKALMLEKDAGNLSELRRCLEIVWTNNLSRSDWAQDFIVASMYDGILHDKVNAIKILEHAIVGLESEMSERRRKGKSIASLARTLGEYHAFLFRLLPNEPMPEAIRTSEFISFADKLRFLARSKTANVWETIKNDILEVSLVEQDLFFADVCSCQFNIPASWFLNEDVPVKVELSVCGLKTVKLDERVSDRKNNADKTFSLKFSESSSNKIYDIIEKEIKQPQDLFQDALQFQLVFDHPEFPVALTFATRKGWDHNPKGDDWFLFGFSAFGKNYLWQPKSGFDTPSYSADVTPQQRRDVFWRKYAFVPLDISEFVCPDHWVGNGIKLEKVKSGKEVSLEYSNVSGNSFRPLVTLRIMNEYGMIIFEAQDEYFDKYTRSERTVEGFFVDDHYVDYNYKYMSPNETRTFSMPKPLKAKYLLIQVTARYNLRETYKR